MGLGGAIAPPLFYRKKETHLLALQTAKQTGLNVTGRLAYSPQRYSLASSLRPGSQTNYY